MPDLPRACSGQQHFALIGIADRTVFGVGTRLVALAPGFDCSWSWRQPSPCDTSCAAVPARLPEWQPKADGKKGASDERTIRHMTPQSQRSEPYRGRFLPPMLEFPRKRRIHETRRRRTLAADASRPRFPTYGHPAGRQFRFEAKHLTHSGSHDRLSIAQDHIRATHFDVSVIHSSRGALSTALSINTSVIYKSRLPKSLKQLAQST